MVNCVSTQSGSTMPGNELTERGVIRKEKREREREKRLIVEKLVVVQERGATDDTNTDSFKWPFGQEISCFRRSKFKCVRGGTLAVRAVLLGAAPQ